MDAQFSDASYGLPPIRPLRPRNVADHYGAAAVAAAHCGVTPPFPPARGIWAHAWTPRHLATDTAALDDYIDFHTILSGREAALWTIGPEEAAHFRARGLVAEAAGLPITYLPAAPVERRPGSLLVMPVHSDEHEVHDNWIGEEYAEAIDAVRDRFSEVVVSIHPSCIERGYWLEDFRKRGYTLVRGAHYTDANGLLRAQRLLSTFEYVSTNGFGSHIAYGAYFGAKVSVYGPFAAVTPESLANDPAFERNPFVRRFVEATSEPALRRELPWLFREPDQAGERRDWAGPEVGAASRRSPADLRRLLGWSAAAVWRWRLLARPALATRGAIGRRLPPGVKRRVWSAVSPAYRLRERRLAALRERQGETIRDVIRTA